ncbi:hypothetical protein [Rhizobium laguerreae]|uniref:hypothetical protein n=1 Tax=Rhizobium laguerreae TaxID=1076926 RepID=UPI001C8FFA77|nr:hypothetical protein [Rhizobium laguerreae]MBY3224365.1 hypothetical protein [Rhizobium laguerreae]
MRDHWGNCVTHFDDDVESFIADYFGSGNRKCFLVAAAGFDPRSAIIPTLLSNALGNNLHALFVREERGETSDELLRQTADGNEEELRKVIPNSQVEPIAIFDPADNAPVGGNRLAAVLSAISLPEGVTDLVLDMSALSMGIAFPAARILVEIADRAKALNLHLMIASNPELDVSIVGEPGEKVQSVRGFAGNAGRESELPKARIWLPQLAHRRRGALDRIRSSLTDLYKVCPILPFPARDPRRADFLIEEFGDEIREDWDVDPRDFMYVSERNPLDSFRSIEMLKKRYDNTMAKIYDPQLILSPVGSKVMAAGAMMAAIKYDLTVQYVEVLRYEIDESADKSPKMDIVHVWLGGPIYDGYERQ